MKRSGHMTIIVGIDGTEDGLRAIDYAAEEAQSAGAQLLVVHVVAAPPTMVAGWGAPAEAFLPAGQRAVKIARAHAENAGVPPADIELAVWQGSVSTTLVKASQAANLMVLGRRGISGLERLFAGSTSTSVAARADCPVVVVPHAWTPGQRNHRVVVGVDGSARSLPALALAVAEASSRQAGLVAVHAWSPPPPFYLEALETKEAVDYWHRSAELTLSETLAGWSERHPEITITKALECAHPVEALIGHSTDADLLVIGTRGRGGIPGLALGTVARAVVAGSSCPILLVRRGPRTLPGVRRRRSEHRPNIQDVVGPLF